MKFHPNIFIVNNEYHFLIFTKKPSQVLLKIGRKTYYENNGGILPVLSLVHRFIVPQKTLNRYGRYEITVRKVVEKKPYFPIYSEPKTTTYAFKNDRYDGLKTYYFADIHNEYEQAKALVKPYPDLDFIIFNGDFGETTKIADILKLNKFFADVTKGSIPVLFVRGNHDTRGYYAEDLYRYVGMNGANGYFKFSFRALEGLALDCGEDKPDAHPEYNNSNYFEQYRKEELAFLKKVKLDKEKYKLAVCHTSFLLTDSMHGQFDIDRKTYAAWANALEQKNLQCMLCGHIHHYKISPASKTADLHPHGYPIVTCSKMDNSRNLFGAAITFDQGKIRFDFAPNNGDVPDHFEI